MTSSAIIYVPSNSGEQRFSCAKDKHGRWILGYEFRFDGGAIQLPVGATEPTSTDVLIHSLNEAEVYVSAMDWVIKAAHWNSELARSDCSDSIPIWSRDEMKAAIRAIATWATAPGRAADAAERLGHRVKRRGPFSHHGVNTCGRVVVRGTTLRLGFTTSHCFTTSHSDSSGALFKAYPVTAPRGVWQAWRLPAYDPEETQRLVAAAVGEEPVHTWNNSMSMVFPIDCDPRIKQSFHPSDHKPAPAPLPEGWL